jgi:hypothetical protein
MDTLDFARDIWKTFDLNNSKGAAMELRENGKVVKSHGRMVNTDNAKELPLLIGGIYEVKKGKR